MNFNLPANPIKLIQKNKRNLNLHIKYRIFFLFLRTFIICISLSLPNILFVYLFICKKKNNKNLGEKETLNSKKKNMQNNNRWIMMMIMIASNINKGSFKIEIYMQ